MLNTSVTIVIFFHHLKMVLLVFFFFNKIRSLHTLQSCFKVSNSLCQGHLKTFICHTSDTEESIPTALVIKLLSLILPSNYFMFPYFNLQHSNRLLHRCRRTETAVCSGTSLVLIQQANQSVNRTYSCRQCVEHLHELLLTGFPLLAGLSAWRGGLRCHCGPPAVRHCISLKIRQASWLNVLK